MIHQKATSRYIALLLLCTVSICVVGILWHRQNSQLPSDGLQTDIKGSEDEAQILPTGKTLILNEDMTGELKGTLLWDVNACSYILRFTYGESDNSDSYYIEDITGCYVENLKGWSVVGESKLVPDGVTYQNSKQTADILIEYQASMGNTCINDFHLGVVTLDLSKQT